MFKKIISAQGFWRSVISIGIAFAILFTIVKWAIEGFKMAYFTSLENPLFYILGLMVSGFVYGFLVTFGKYRGLYKKGKL